MRPFLLAVFSGVLLALSLPPYDFSWLAWFALAPMLVAAQNRKPLEAAGIGLLVGATCGLIQARWSGGAALIFAWLPFLWFALLCALVSVAFRGAMAKWQAQSSLARVLWVACVGVAGEWLTTLTPLPINFAVTQHRVLELIQIADITGIWGVSFLLWFANAAIANAIVFRKREMRRAQITPLATCALLILISFAYSMNVLSHPPTTKTVRVAAIQDFNADEVQNVAPNARSSTRNGSTISRETMTREVAKSGAQLVVWSENCLGTDFDARSNKDATKLLARELKIFLVPGYTDSFGEKQTNCAAIINPNGEVVGVHRKIHLFLAERSSTQAGTQATSFPTSLGKIGMAICFDTCWTNILREETQRGAQIIAMPNFDPPVPRGVVHLLHGAMLPFRAVENRVPIVRADPNGQSGTVDAQGRVLEIAPMWKSATEVCDVHLGDGHATFFAQNGDWLAWLCVVCACAGLVWKLNLKQRARPSKKNCSSGEVPL